MSVAISQISVLLQKVLSFNLVGFVYLFEKYAVRLSSVSRKFLKSSVLISLFWSFFNKCSQFSEVRYF